MEKINLIITAQDVENYNSLYFKEHPRAKKPPIKAPQHPSINTYTRMSFQAANNLKQKWKDFILFILNDRSLCNMKISKCRIIFTTYFKDVRRRDPDNVSPKYILDGFVEGGLLVDDNSNCIDMLSVRCCIDKKHPRMEFVFEIIEREKGENK